MVSRSNDRPDAHALGLEIKRGFPTVHVKRNRAMLMRDEPPALTLAVTSGLAPPHIEFHSACGCCADTVEAVAECYGIADGDVQVANLQADGALE